MKIHPEIIVGTVLLIFTVDHPVRNERNLSDQEACVNEAGRGVVVPYSRYYELDDSDLCSPLPYDHRGHPACDWSRLDRPKVPLSDF